MMAQYSIPFCVALALFRDPRDPVSFEDSALRDAAIRTMCGRVTVTQADPPTRVAGASIVTVLLKDGRSLTRTVEEFDGTPSRPLTRAALHDKFCTLARVRYGEAAAALFERLQNLEAETDLSWIGS